MTRPANPIHADLTLLGFLGGWSNASAAGTGSATGAWEGMSGESGEMWSVMAGVATGRGTPMRRRRHALRVLDDAVVAFP